MNRRLIQKILDELSKENPKLDYVRGILETIIEGLPEDKTSTSPYIPPHLKPLDQAIPVIGEGQELDIYALQNLDKIKALANQSNKE